MTIEEYSEYDKRYKEFLKSTINTMEQTDPSVFDVNYVKVLFDIFIE
jgi:hypothetical protein